MSQSFLDVPDFTGWPLDEARAALNECAQPIEIRIAETAPPSRPVRDVQARPVKKPKPNQERAPRPLPNWGNWRVLRCTTIESEARVIELLVAREELAPQEVEVSIVEAQALEAQFIAAPI